MGEGVKQGAQSITDWTINWVIHYLQTRLKWTSSKLKNFVLWKTLSLEKMKRQGTDWEKCQRNRIYEELEYKGLEYIKSARVTKQNKQTSN